MTECNAMKRPGKPDTGNPFVRFDEERSGSAELTTTVGSIRLRPLRLLYRNAWLVPDRPLGITGGSLSTHFPNDAGATGMPLVAAKFKEHRTQN
jgi:hypothetical protein